MNQAISLLKKKNARITRAREAVISIIFEANFPLDAPTIISKLNSKNIKVNKTTVYRELDFLLKNGLLKLVFLKPSIVHYESALLPHHHHLVCTNCDSIEEVDCVIDEDKLLKKVEKKGFNLKNHKFEMYGVCASCI